jgi:hypothetical protein
MDEVVRKYEEQEAEVFEPEAGMLVHINDYDDFDARLEEAEADYDHAVALYKKTDPNKEEIMKAAAFVEDAAKILIARALVAFHMYPASPEHMKKAQIILDRMTKDANCRERTCSQYCHEQQKSIEGLNDRLYKLYKEKQKRMQFLNRCMQTQSVYDKRAAEGKGGAGSQYEKEKKASERYAKIRSFLPKGAVLRPPRIFPHDPIPEGMPVPMRPAAYDRVKDLEDSGLMVYDWEHRMLTLPPDYISEDGLIDAESVVWDWKNRTCTMKYRGGVPVTWDFIQLFENWEVPDPDTWGVQYQNRLFDQVCRAQRPGLFVRKIGEGEIPEYDRIPI